MFWPFIEIDGELTYCPLADFGTQNLREGKDIYGKAVIAQPLTAHLPLHNAAQVSGKIVVVERGQCDFVTKVTHAQAAGAIAVVVANTSRENPDEAFVMDAGRRSDEEISVIRIPALMVCYGKAVSLYEQLRECYLDRRELSMTIKFLGAQTSAYVLQQIEETAKRRQTQAQEATLHHEREREQREAAELLRKRLGKNTEAEVLALRPESDVALRHSQPQTPSSSRAQSTSSGSSTSSSSESARPTSIIADHASLSLPAFFQDAMDTLSIASSHELFDTRSIRSLQQVKMTNHWCPITTSLLIMDLQNYFALPQNEKCVEQLQSHSSGSSIDFYKRIKSQVVPNTQDILLACRACEGMEIIYSVVESSTRDGRERSRAHKHAGIHVPKGGFGAQVLTKVGPSDDDIIIPRTGANLFESTNVDYVLRNLGVSHLVVLGISMMKSIQLCVQTALDRGYQITLIKDAIVTSDGSDQLNEMLQHCEKLGCQVVSASAFVAEIHGYADANDNNAQLFLTDETTRSKSNLKSEMMEADGGEESDDHRSDTSMKDHSSPTSGQPPPTLTDTESPEKEFSNEPLAASDAASADADGDRIGGFLWKFPSEGSNSKPGDDLYSPADSHAGTPYPRKCRYCQSAWVSSYVQERRHWKQCNPEASTDVTTEPKSLGVARRVWCEVDSTLTALQWREDVDSSQDVDLNRIAFREMAAIDLLGTPIDAFRVTTTSGRRVVFQCRANDTQNVPVDHEQEQVPEQDRKELLEIRALDAKQWSEYLQIFSRFTQDQDQHHVSYETDDVYGVEPAEEQIYECVDTHSEVLGEITRAIVAKDVDALEELLEDEAEDGGRASTLALLDDNGSSLLVVAFKLGGDERIIRALVKAGVDCNRQNKDGETPLLLAAASGELELLRVLLTIGGLDVNQRCAMGATAFHAAANAGEVDVLRLLCNYGGVSTHDVDDNGWTALHYAAVCPTGLQAMCFLCELMPEMVDTQCLQGNTALHLAAGYGCVENARVLLQTAANPHIMNADGDTAYHVALHNHHISCAMAINEYMNTPRDAYERVVAVDFTGTKSDEVVRAEVTPRYSQGHEYIQPVDREESYYGYGDDDGETLWVECATEDQIPYYYNYVTGVSTWHKPELSTVHAETETLPPAAPTQVKYYPSDAGKQPPDGHKLPLCMIPLVSPLVSLDDPTAATKFDSRRRKDRERRRSRKLRSQQSQGSLDNLPPPPPPPSHPTRHHHQRRSASFHEGIL